MTETNVSGYSKDSGKLPQRLRKTNADHGGTRKLRARSAGTELTTAGAPAASQRIEPHAQARLDSEQELQVIIQFV